jgi:hypothetical protein
MDRLRQLLSIFNCDTSDNDCVYKFGKVRVILFYDIVSVYTYDTEKQYNIKTVSELDSSLNADLLFTIICAIHAYSEGEQ